MTLFEEFVVTSQYIKLLALFLLCVAARLLVLGHYPSSLADDDTTKYLEMGRNPFVETLGLLPGQDPINGRPPFDKIDSHYPTCEGLGGRARVCAEPLYPMILSIFQFTLNEFELSTIMQVVSYFQIILSAILAVLIFKICFKVFKSQRASYLASLLYCLSLPSIVSSIELLKGMTATFLLGWACWLIVSINGEAERRFFKVFIAGVLLALLMHTKAFAVIYMLPLGLVLVVSYFKGEKTKLRQYLIVFFGVVTITLPWSLRTYIQYGDVVVIKKMNIMERFSLFEEEPVDKSKKSSPTVKGVSQLPSGDKGVTKTLEFFLAHGNRIFKTDIDIRKILIHKKTNFSNPNFALKFISYVSHGLLLVFALGAIIFKPKYLWNEVGAVLIFGYLIHILFDSTIRRYLVPLIPFICMYASLGIFMSLDMTKTLISKVKGNPDSVNLP